LEGRRTGKTKKVMKAGWRTEGERLREGARKEYWVRRERKR
jgi:hypothetical protein